MPTKDKNLQIEGLRGITIILIALYHLLYKFPGEDFVTVISDSWPGQSVVKAIPFFSHMGQMGVAVFFVISAYFLYSKAEVSNPLSYWGKKLWRLWPVYAVSVSITFICSFFLGYPGYGDGNLSIKDYVRNLLFVNGFVNKPYIDGAHWYMTALVSFILVMGLLKVLKIDRNMLSYIAWICIAAVSKAVSMYMPTALRNVHVDLIFSGIYKVLGGGFIGIACLGILLHMYTEQEIKSQKEIISGVILIILSLGYTYVTTNKWRVITALIAVVVVRLCIGGKLRFLSCKPFVLAGLISYPFYLCHQELGYFIEYALCKRFGTYNSVYVIAALLVTVAIATLLYLIDKVIHRIMR